MKPRRPDPGTSTSEIGTDDLAQVVARRLLSERVWFIYHPLPGKGAALTVLAEQIGILDHLIKLFEVDPLAD